MHCSSRSFCGFSLLLLFFFFFSLWVDSVMGLSAGVPENAAKKPFFIYTLNER